MPAEIPQNESPLNRAAAKALKQVGQHPAPNRLHAMQLAHWALESGTVKPEDYLLAESVEMLLYRGTPEWATRVILGQVGECHEDEESPVDYSPGMSPEALAGAILDSISASLAQLNPDYLDADRLNTLRPTR